MISWDEPWMGLPYVPAITSHVSIPLSLPSLLWCQDKTKLRQCCEHIWLAWRTEILSCCLCDWTRAAFLLPRLHSLGPSWAFLRKSYSFSTTGNSLLSRTVQANSLHSPSFCFSYAYAAHLLLFEMHTWIFPCILTYGWIPQFWHQRQIPKSSPPSQLSLFPLLLSSRFLILEPEGE